MSRFYTVWHIADQGVYPVIKAIPEEQARAIADTLQFLSDHQLIPGEFYMAVPTGSDADWIEQMKGNPSPLPPVEYMQVYHDYRFQVQSPSHCPGDDAIHHIT